MEEWKLSLPNKNTIGKPSALAKVIGPRVQNKIICLVIRAHNILAGTHRVQQDWEEDRITSALGIEISNLWRSLRRCSPVHSYTPQTQFPLFPKLSKRGKARTIDFVFLKGYTEQVYFAFECKIVNHSDTKLITEYIDNGMNRYISGYYSTNLFVGGMIGYMFNNEVVLTVNRINYKIQTCGNLSANDCLKQDITIQGWEYLYESKHRRLTDNNEFAIRHLFFAF